jgi:hypothetical protein
MWQAKTTQKSIGLAKAKATPKSIDLATCILQHEVIYP